MKQKIYHIVQWELSEEHILDKGNNVNRHKAPCRIEHHALVLYDWREGVWHEVTLEWNRDQIRRAFQIAPSHLKFIPKATEAVKDFRRELM